VSLWGCNDDDGVSLKNKFLVAIEIGHVILIG